MGSKNAPIYRFLGINRLARFSGINWPLGAMTCGDHAYHDASRRSKAGQAGREGMQFKVRSAELIGLSIEAGVRTLGAGRRPGPHPSEIPISIVVQAPRLGWHWLGLCKVDPDQSGGQGN